MTGLRPQCLRLHPGSGPTTPKGTTRALIKSSFMDVPSKFEALLQIYWLKISVNSEQPGIQHLVSLTGKKQGGESPDRQNAQPLKVSAAGVHAGEVQLLRGTTRSFRRGKNLTELFCGLLGILNQFLKKE